MLNAAHVHNTLTTCHCTAQAGALAGSAHPVRATHHIYHVARVVLHHPVANVCMYKQLPACLRRVHSCCRNENALSACMHLPRRLGNSANTTGCSATLLSQWPQLLHESHASRLCSCSMPEQQPGMPPRQGNGVQQPSSFSVSQLTPRGTWRHMILIVQSTQSWEHCAHSCAQTDKKSCLRTRIGQCRRDDRPHNQHKTETKRRSSPPQGNTQVPRSTNDIPHSKCRRGPASLNCYTS